VGSHVLENSRSTLLEDKVLLLDVVYLWRV
jgi:hypothetical protein